MKKLSLILICLIGLSFFNRIYSQNIDSLKREEKINLIFGVKLFFTRATPEIRTASNIGADWYLFKNKRLNISYRNFFSVFITPKEPFLSHKNIILLNSSNSFNFCYKIPIKSSYVKFGLGPYSAREQDFTDQYLYLKDPQQYGLEVSIYTKLKWLNIGYRHQIQLADRDNTTFEPIDLFRFSLCIEVPINIK